MSKTATYALIETVTLGSAAASVSFNVSGTASLYTDLRLVIDGIISTAIDPVTINFNGDTASNYSYTLLYGDGTSAASARSASLTAIRAGYLGTVQGITSVDIMDYSNTTTNKTVIGRGSVSNWGVTAQVSLWRSTAAITSMTIQSLSSYNFATGTTFRLYGIQAGNA
jgi:hypothetical protein